MKLSQMKQLLEAEQIQLTKSLGQNFLHDANQLRRIVEAAELASTDKVLEIGPGLGPLTEMLIERASVVWAIEKDARLVEVLKKGFAAQSAAPEFDEAGKRGFWLMQADALKFLQQHPRDWSGWKVVSNLPYSVASPILVELAQAVCGPERMVATLQIEVARRLMARMGDEDYGVLSLLVQLEYEPKGWFKIPAGCFFPEPEVDSACVSLWRREQALLGREQRATFTAIVKRSFSQRRKMVGKLLKTDWAAEVLQRAFEQAQVLPETRAERITLEQFVGLTESLSEGDRKKRE
jgi:16S rRNA (adenine1518-N6/adenine1519-N6)-dimethyltransferase